MANAVLPMFWQAATSRRRKFREKFRHPLVTLDPRDRVAIWLSLADPQSDDRDGTCTSPCSTDRPAWALAIGSRSRFLNSAHVSSIPRIDGR
jgi:hypothetical protein